MPEFVDYKLAEGFNVGEVRPALVLSRDNKNSTADLLVFTKGVMGDGVESTHFVMGAVEGDENGNFSNSTQPSPSTPTTASAVPTIEPMQANVPAGDVPEPGTVSDSLSPDTTIAPTPPPDAPVTSSADQPTVTSADTVAPSGALTNI